MPVSFFDGDIILPATPSPFIAVGRNGDGNEIREIWDLSQKKRVGAIRGKFPIDRPYALSADGLLFAAKATDAGNTAAILKARTGKLAARLALPGPFLDVIAFAGATKLITLTYADKTIRVWDVKNGKPLYTIDPGADIDRDSIAISPGGRYVAFSCSSKNILLIHDLNDGKRGGIERGQERTFQPQLQRLGFFERRQGTGRAVRQLRHVHQFLDDLGRSPDDRAQAGRQDGSQTDVRF